jgi:hypothetical protein
MEKANTGLNKSSAVKTTDTDLTERIRRKAREIWEKKGRTQGKDLEYWLEAEKLVKSGKA